MDLMTVSLWILVVYARSAGDIKPIATFTSEVHCQAAAVRMSETFRDKIIVDCLEVR